MDETYLYHYGILGQKWGIRRFQNEDGTLTPAGRARYSDGNTTKDEYEKAKSELKVARSGSREANKAYNKAFNSAYNKNYQSFSPIKSHREESAKRWEDAYDKGQIAREADAKYLEAGKNYIKAGGKYGVQKLSDFLNKESTQKAIKVGAAVAITSLSAYATYKVLDLNDQLIESIRSDYKNKAGATYGLSKGHFDYSNYFNNKASEYKNKYNERKNSKDYDDVDRNTMKQLWDSTSDMAETNRNYAIKYKKEADEYTKKATQKDYSLKEKIKKYSGT